jgi:transcription elongation factor Elf1
MSESQQMTERVVKNRYQCPECDSRKSDRSHFEEEIDALEEHRMCGKCGLQWTITYTEPTILDREER